MLDGFSELNTLGSDYYPAVYALLFDKSNKTYVGVTSNAYRLQHSIKSWFKYDYGFSMAVLNEHKKNRKYKFLVYKAKSFEEANIIKNTILNVYKGSEWLLNRRLCDNIIKRTTIHLVDCQSTYKVNTTYSLKTTLTLKELQAEKSVLLAQMDEKIEAARLSELPDALRQARELISVFGFTSADLFQSESLIAVTGIDSSNSDYRVSQVYH